MRDTAKALQKIESLPDIFYRYQLVNGEIETVVITKYKMKYHTGFSYQRYLANGNIVEMDISRPHTIDLGKYDTKRKCVFFEEQGKEAEAAKLIDAYYEDLIAREEAKIKSHQRSRQMIQKIKGNYVRRTSSGVMKCGSSLSFGSEANNAEWDEHYKKIDAQMKADKTTHGVWSNRPLWDRQYISRKSGNRKSMIFSTII